MIRLIKPITPRITLQYGGDVLKAYEWKFLTYISISKSTNNPNTIEGIKTSHTSTGADTAPGNTSTVGAFGLNLIVTAANTII